jgi:hypothetical protein
MRVQSLAREALVNQSTTYQKGGERPHIIVSMFLPEKFALDCAA